MSQAKRKVAPKQPGKEKPATDGAVTKKNSLPAPSMSEEKAITEAANRIASRRSRIRVLADGNDGVVKLGSPHSDEEGFSLQLLDVFGTKSPDFWKQAIGRLGAILRCRGAQFPTQTELNAGLAAIDGMRPADEIEAMLALQMVATHETAMEMLTRAKQAEFMPQLDGCGTLAVKLLRTYTAQVEALARLRRGGEQRVIVQHVNVNDGGRAIVAVSPSGGGRDNDENRGQPHAPENAGAITFAPGTTLPSADEARDAMPVASGRR
jgi:hypothetical protein